MFERFTEDARQVIVFAQEESVNLKHNRIAEEHILLGLTRVERGVAARVLDRLGLTYARVRSEVVRLVGEGATALRSGQVPFTPGAKKILEGSLKEALAARDAHIGTVHVLLGLVRDGSGAASRILDEFDVSAEKIRGEVPHVPPEVVEHGVYRGPEPVVVGRATVGFASRTDRILRLAAENAQDWGRSEIVPGDLLEPLLSDEAIASVLTHLGVDVPALRERLQHIGWSEPGTPRDG